MISEVAAGAFGSVYLFLPRLSCRRWSVGLADLQLVFLAACTCVCVCMKRRGRTTISPLISPPHSPRERGEYTMAPGNRLLLFMGGV